ncbi:MAG: DUF6011 domain-containing protein [Streptosporangiaceae bacterium]
MTRETAPLTDDDQFWLGRWTVGRGSDRRPGMDWLAARPPPDRVRAMLVKFLDRYGPGFICTRVLADHLGVDPDQLYAGNWPRKAARLAAESRERGDDPHADKLHAALVALMFCANCGRPLADPVSIERGMGPDCWPRIAPAWRAAITGRMRPLENVHIAAEPEALW